MVSWHEDVDDHLIYLYIYKAEKPSVRLQFRWGPTIFSPANARIEALFVPN